MVFHTSSGQFATAVIATLHRIVYEGGMPTRVILQDVRFEAIHPRPENMTLVSEIYIREDGWSLGATHKTAREARGTWENDWVVQLRKQPWGWQVIALKSGDNDDS